MGGCFFGGFFFFGGGGDMNESLNSKINIIPCTCNIPRYILGQNYMSGVDSKKTQVNI